MNGYVLEGKPMVIQFGKQGGGSRGDKIWRHKKRFLMRVCVCIAYFGGAHRQLFCDCNLSNVCSNSKVVFVIVVETSLEKYQWGAKIQIMFPIPIINKLNRSHPYHHDQTFAQYHSGRGLKRNVAHCLLDLAHSRPYEYGQMKKLCYLTDIHVFLPSFSSEYFGLQGTWTPSFLWRWRVLTNACIGKQIEYA